MYTLTPAPRTRLAVRSTLAFASLIVLCARAESAPYFMGLGDAPAMATGVSDGENPVVAGTFSGSGAFRWTIDTGIVGLGGGTISGLDGSSDGTWIVGYTFPSLKKAFRWSEATGIVDLSNGNDDYNVAYGVSADGSVIVGYQLAPNMEGFRWTQASGVVGLGWANSTGSKYSWALSVSGDGNVIVGQTSTVSSGLQAFRWTQASGMVALGDFDGGAMSSIATRTSADGSVVVGRGTTAVGQEAFRWTEAAGMIGLGTLPGNLRSIANDVSADGSIVIGSASDQSTSSAFIWDNIHGMRHLQNLLTNDYGLGSSLAGWKLSSATAISGDGKVIVGNGRNPDGVSVPWIANMRTTPGDFDADGDVDGADFVVWQTNFPKPSDATLSQGDGDYDGDVDGADFVIWQTNFPTLSSPGASAVPEPSAILLALLSVAIAFALHHRLSATSFTDGRMR